MKHLAAIIIFAFLPTCPVHAEDTATSKAVAASEQDIPVWLPSSTTEINFEVLRKGKPFGSHVLTFDPRDDGTLRVTNDIELTAKVGPFTVYQYRHASTETWTDGRLTALEGETRKEGDDLIVSVTTGDGELVVEGTNYTGAAPAGIIPSSHWHSTEVFSEQILSSEGGQLLDVKTENMGHDTVIVAGAEIEATKFKLVSDLTVYLWYDAEGRWVKCAFEARGQTIEYILKALY